MCTLKKCIIDRRKIGYVHDCLFYDSYLPTYLPTYTRMVYPTFINGIDTHVWDIAIRDYGCPVTKTKTLTPQTYRDIGVKFRSVFLDRPGWAHTTLFTAELDEYRRLLPLEIQKEMEVFKSNQKKLKEVKRKEMIDRRNKAMAMIGVKDVSMEREVDTSTQAHAEVQEIAESTGKQNRKKRVLLSENEETVRNFNKEQVEEDDITHDRKRGLQVPPNGKGRGRIGKVKQERNYGDNDDVDVKEDVREGWSGGDENGIAESKEDEMEEDRKSVV